MTIEKKNMPEACEDRYKISVIIPVYNVAKYVCQCIDSILNQTFKDIEIIAVDDSSSDNSYELVKSRYGSCENLRIYKNKQNIGLAETRNKGMEMARGKYIYFMDSDDVLLPKALGDLHDQAEKSGADMVHMSGWYQSVQEDFSLNNIQARLIRDREYHREPVQFPIDIAGRIEESFIKRKYLISACVNLYRRKFLTDNGIYFPDMIYEDNPFMFACYAATDRIFTIPGAYYIYRQRRGSITHDGSCNRLQGAVEAMLLGSRYIAEMAAKRDVPISEDLIYNAQAALFREIWPAVLMFYDGGSVISEENVAAVEKALRQHCPRDYAFISILIHQAATLNRRN